jgi:hypothetical protein
MARRIPTVYSIASMSGGNGGRERRPLTSGQEPIFPSSPPAPWTRASGRQRRRSLRSKEVRSRQRAVFRQLPGLCRSLCQGPAPLAWDGSQLPGLPRRPLRLTELRELLLRPGQVPYAVWDTVWAELVWRARDGGPEWVVGAAGMALPGLRRAHARLTHGSPRPTRRSWPPGCSPASWRRCTERIPDGGRLPGVLCWAGYNSARHQALADVRYIAAAGPGLDVLVDSAAPPVGYGHPDLLLAHAVTGGLLTAMEAELIGSTRLENVPLARAAQHLGVSVAAVKMRRRRAEQRLVAALVTPPRRPMERAVCGRTHGWRWRWESRPPLS